MGGRAIWKGFIAFGGVETPVKLHSAVREERISFHLLHRLDSVRLKQQMVCAHEDVPVPPEEQVRGFDLGDGKYLLVEAAELAQTEPEDSRRIEVHEFVQTAQIDPVFRERAYYLEPDRLSRGYRDLAGAMADLAVEGICTWTMRKRFHFGALQTDGRLLRLQTLRYADEVVAIQSLDLPDTPLSEKEVKIGMDLIAHLAAPFEPRKFVNEHQRKLQALIDKKVRGEKIAILHPRRLKATAPDKLLQALEASLRKVA